MPLLRKRATQDPKRKNMSHRSGVYALVFYGLVCWIFSKAESAEGETNMMSGDRKGTHLRVQRRELASCEQSLWGKDGFIGTFVVLWLSIIANGILGFLLWKEHVNKKKEQLKASRIENRQSMPTSKNDYENNPTPRSSSRGSRPDQRLNAPVSTSNPLQHARNHPSQYGLQSVSLSQIYGGSKRGELVDTQEDGHEDGGSPTSRSTTQAAGSMATNASALNGDDQRRNTAIHSPGLKDANVFHSRSSRRTLAPRNAQRRTSAGNSPVATASASEKSASKTDTSPSPQSSTAPVTTTTSTRSTSGSLSSLDGSPKRKAKIKVSTGTESVIHVPKFKPPPPS